MISITISRRYAKALLEIGLKDGNHAALGKDLDDMAGLLRENKELRVVLWSPALPKPKRKAIAGKIAERLGLTPTTRKFIEILIQKKRISLFPEIAQIYHALCDEAAGRTRVTLITSMELPSDLVQEISGRIESWTGKEVVLSVEKDPSLIGGFLTQIGNFVIDGSLKGQLEKLRQKLYQNSRERYG